MKITIGIPSRGRPLELAASIIALDKTKSTGHEVEYLVAVDDDDWRTKETILDLLEMGIGVTGSYGPRPLGLGEIHNRMLAETDPEAVFMLWSDRLVPIEMSWDHAIAMAAMEYPTRVLWMDSVHLVGPGQFIITPAWRAALPDGLAVPGIFPYWFEDSALEETDHLVHGFPRVACWAKAAGPRTDKTNRMRDLKFWIDVFARTRPRRIKRADKIAKAMGLPIRDHADVIAHFEKRDRDFLARADELTEKYGATGEPDETYLAAKAQAERILAELAS